MGKIEYLIDKFYKICDKIGKHNVMLIAFITIVLIITGLYSTFSFVSSNEGLNVVDGLRTYRFVLDSTLSDTSVIVPANSDKNLDVIVTNSESTSLKYGLYYSSTGAVTIGYTSRSLYSATGIIEENGSYTISLKVTNETMSDVTVTLGVAYGFENGGELAYPEAKIAISMYPYVSADGTNLPNLDDGNLIPVYYDESSEVWKKADWANIGSSWYNYDEKRWANAVMIGDDIKRSTYQDAEVGTVIVDADITAFMVWIPRFKYNVWNITRQGGDEATYAYPAYTNGINIEWENDIENTGNVICSYNINNNNPETTLSDNCIYNETDTITPTSENTNYASAWYTHPAFTFGGEEKTGFWVGKFETTGTAQVPTVLPDVIALTNQNISTQFITSKKFQSYVSSSVDAHMLTNLEWGAVVYLTHSIYGLCDEVACRDTYINNSESMYTGRSSGVLISNSFSSVYGTYNYKGYLIDNNTGVVTETKDIAKVASTTGNITGVYDIVGGAYEHVMANMVNSNGEFNSLASLVNWSSLNISNMFYYNAYSYVETIDEQVSFNRSILGDATAEVLGSVGNSIDAWQPGSGITGSYSGFVTGDTPWLVRSGNYNSISTGNFMFDVSNGGANLTTSFRLSVS